MTSPSQRWEDAHGRRVTYLRLSVTDRCNYRCVYCMPAHGVALRPSEELLTFEEIIQVVSVLARGGVRRVRLTGGEPLVRRGLPKLIRRLKSEAGVEEVVMTTNGHLLSQHASALKDAGLDGLTVSVDSLNVERFRALSRRGDLERVLGGIRAARAAGFERIKVNTVVIRGFNDDELLELVSWSLEEGLVLRLIEFMPIGAETIWGQGRDGGCVPAQEMLSVLRARWLMAPEGMASGAGPARYWRLSGPGVPASQEGRARVGIISAVTQCFCDACNRIRLTPQGGLRACLADDREVDLREVVRGGGGDAAIMAAVSASLGSKLASHSFDMQGGAVTRKQMVSIGG